MVGATGFYFIGQGWTFYDCLYMTLITVSTVGFGETLQDMHGNDAARAWTAFLIVAGSGTLLYVVSNVTALIIEGELRGEIRRRRMEKRIRALSDHIIVCGVGTTGEQVVAELLRGRHAFVVIDQNAERIARVQNELESEFPFIVGDATEDYWLEQAGIERARGLIAALNDDRDNLFATISARALNAKARIVAKAVEPSTQGKLGRAGADAVVAPNFIGGMRLVSEMVRPTVVKFLDRMMSDEHQNLRMEEIAVPKGSQVEGKSLARSDIRKATGALIVAVHDPNDEYVYNPPGSHVLQAGARLIIIATPDHVDSLRDFVARG